MAIVTLNGVEVPSPQTIEMSFRNIGKSETTAAGTTVFDLVAVKRDAKMTWRFLAPEDASIITGTVKTSPFFSLAFVDPETSENVESEYMLGDIIVKPFRYDDDGKIIGYTDVTVNFKER